MVSLSKVGDNVIPGREIEDSELVDEVSPRKAAVGVSPKPATPEYVACI